MDRIVQKCISLILVAIYEPQFELRNRSFGFRPKKSTKDAITALTTKLTNGMKSAIEGDVEAAYDTVVRKRLIEILSKKIQDKQFLKLIEERLNYDYVEKGTKNIFRPNLGIPQGGIDSPYLFNIYMSELDEYIHNELQSYVNGLNNKQLGEVNRSVNPSFTSIKASRKRFFRLLNLIRKNKN